jgi:methylthioribulose-1-phosphate dehydratase
MATTLDEAIEAILAAGRRLDSRGLAPATSGNYSVRLGDGRIAVTVSGRHKGRLTRDDIMLVDPEGTPLEPKKPSAETALHMVVYKLHPQANAVLHVHSVPVVALTRYLHHSGELLLEGYEMLKAFPGIPTHEAKIGIPIFDNSQDVPAMARDVVLDTQLRQREGRDLAPAYLIRGHGVYGWGKDMEEAERVIEGLDHLLSCEIEAIRLGVGGTA